MIRWYPRCPRCGYRELRPNEFLCDPCKKAVEETP